MKQIGALWKKEGKHGDYFSGEIDLGVLGNAKIAVFQNEKGEGDEKKPDARIVLFENNKSEG